VTQYDAATLFEHITVEAAGFSHDGARALVAMDTSGVANLYAIPTAGGEPVRLTTSAETRAPWATSPTIASV
jgi:Tol biopolymer transport system component